MPQVPNIDSVGYSPVNENLPGVQANPTAFGASVGEALKGFGAQLDQATTAIGDRLSYIAANNAANKFMDLSHQVTSGDPNNPNDTGYFGLSGQAAVDGRQAAFQKLQDGYKNIMSGLDPVAAQRFDNETRAMLNMTQGRLDGHFQQQVRVAGLDSAKASEQLATQGLGIYAADENGFQTQLQTLHKAVARQVAITGGGPDVLAASTQAADERAYAGRVQSLIGQGNLTLAHQVLEQNEARFSPNTFEELSLHLQPMLDKQAGQAAFQAVAGGATGPTSLDNNVGNIRATSTPWAGKGAPQNGFETFDTPESGVRAAVRNWQSYAQSNGGSITLAQGIAKWAPKGDGANNPEAYAATVANAAGMSPNDPVPVNDAAKMAAIVQAQYRVEKGANATPIDPGVFQRGAAAAISGGGATPSNSAASFAPSVPNLDDQVAKIEAMPISMEAKQHAIGLATENYHAMTAATAADRNALTDNIRGGIAMLEAGKDYTPDPIAIRRLLPEKADGILADIDQAKQLGQAANGVQFAAPAEIQAKLAQLKANVDHSAPDGFIDNQALLQTYQKAVEARQKALADDPASYVGASPVVQAAYKAINQNDPKSVETYGMAMLGEQARLGVAPADQRLLSVGQANDAVAKLVSADPGTQDVGAMLQKITGAYGRFGNVALGDLVKAGLPAQYQMLAAMTPEPGQPDTQAATRSTFQGILKDAAAMGGTAKYRDSIPPADAKLIDSGVPDALRDFQATTRLNDGGQDLYANVAQSVKLMAYGLVAKQGLDGSTALAKAEQAIIGDKYDIDGTMLAPKGKMNDVQKATSNVLRGLKAGDLADIGGNPALTPEQRQGIALDAAQRGTWVPNHDSSGLVLMGNRGDRYVPVRMKDGSPVQVLFDHLNEMARPASQPQQAPSPATQTAAAPAPKYVDPGLPYAATE
jgi:hypothetical protein